MPVKDAGVCGWVFYDAECRFCVAAMKRWGGLFARRGFVWLPLQSPGTAARLGVSEVQLLEAMWLQLADGRVASGVNAWSELMRRVWWLWPLGMLMALPGFNAIARVVYRWIARNRYCLGGSCKIHSHRAKAYGAVDLVFFALVMGAVGVVGRAWTAWIYMWALAAVLWGFTKWIAWRDARSIGIRTPPGRTLGWFLLWPGMDGRAFFAPARSADRRVREASDKEGGPQLADPVVHAPVGEWLAAFVKTGLGAALVWFVCPRWLAATPMVLGWLGMIGISLFLHFGLFHLLSLLWRSYGVNAAHIMDRPLAAVSLADFWGARWNLGFSIPARRFLLMPVARRFGTGAGTWVVFIISGVMHDLVISVPAKGGYGLPTLYFLLQGAGIWFERTKLGRVCGLGSGIRGWVFTFTLAAGPAFWLFHPPFVHNVVLPMLEAIGAR